MNISKRSLERATTFALLFPLVALAASPALPPEQRLPEAAWKQDDALKTETHIVKQSYCEGDGVDIFAVNLDLEIQVTNNSERTIYIRSDMVQRFMRVATDLEAASQGMWMYESGGGMIVWDADHKFLPVQEIRILPGRSAILRVEGDVLARYKLDPPIPGTIPPGHYALQFMFQPEKGFPRFSHADLKSLVVGPIALEVREDVRSEQCR